MKIHYYPGCTLKEKATNLDDSTREAMNALGYELVEPANWTCCGAEYPLSDQKIAGLAAPARILRQVGIEGGGSVVTTCAFCFNVLKRTNVTLKKDILKHKQINAFIADDIAIDPKTKNKTTGFPPYNGEVKVLHLIEFLRDEVGYHNIRAALKRDLGGLKVAPYYGCRLLRPGGDVGIDSADDPVIFEEFLQNLGCEVIDFPFKQECCGSYLSVSRPAAASEASYQILRSAALNGANVMALSCPLCYYNLDRRQDRIRDAYADFSGFPVLFFTQILAWALGAAEEVLGLDQHYYNPKSVLGIEPKAEVAR